MRRFVLPSVSILFGLFFVLLPFIGTNDENAKHTGALNLISLCFGLFMVAVSVWYMVSGYRARSRPPT